MINRGQMQRSRAVVGYRDTNSTQTNIDKHLSTQRMLRWVWFNMPREIVHVIGFWQRAVEGGERDGLVQDPTLKCLKSIHTEN